jgi:predicted metal-dependent hydrolase
LVPAREVVAFVQKNETWITQQQNRFESKKSRLVEGLEIKTKQNTIVIQSGEKNVVEKKGNTVYLCLKDLDSAEAQSITENVLTQVYRHEAKRILPERLRELAVEHGFYFSKITIRDNRRNWGSCSSKNNISLNLQMMKLPDKLIDYILLHELVHTKIKNHGPEFWKELDRLTGNQAKEMAKQVKKFSTYTI